MDLRLSGTGAGPSAASHHRRAGHVACTDGVRLHATATWRKPKCLEAQGFAPLPEVCCSTSGRGRSARGRRADVRVMAVAEMERPVATKTSQGEKVLVRISVPFRVAFGQVIKAVGSAKEFGQWDVLAAPKFEWTEGDIWVGNFTMDPGLYEYKVVIFSEASKESKWENGLNRVLEVPKGPGTLSTSCYWGSPSTQGWFTKGEYDASVRLTPTSTSSKSSSSSNSSSSSASSKATGDKAASMLQKGWDAMFQRSKTPDRERSRSPSPSLERSPSSSFTSKTTSSSSSSASEKRPTVSAMRLSKWAAFVDDDDDEDLSSKYKKTELKKVASSTSSSSSTSKSSSGSSGSSGSSASSRTTSSSTSKKDNAASHKESAAWEAGRALRDDITEGGERMMRSLSNMWNGSGLRQLPEVDSRVMLKRAQDVWSESSRRSSGKGTPVGSRHKERKQSQEFDSKPVLSSVRDTVDQWANSEKYKHRRDPSPVAEQGRKLIKAVANVVSTKSPSAIRAEEISIEDLKEAYKYKKPIPLSALASRRPGQKIPEYEQAGKSRSSSRSPTPQPASRKSPRKATPSFQLPRFEFPGLPILGKIDLDTVGGAAIVMAVVLAIFGSDVQNIRGNLGGRAEAIRAAFMDPLPPKASGKTPKPARSPAKATPQPSRNPDNATPQPARAAAPAAAKAAK